MRRNIFICVVFAIFIGIMWIIFLTNIQIVSNDNTTKVADTIESEVKTELGSVTYHMSEPSSEIITFNVSEFKSYCPLPLDDDAVLQEVCRESDVPYVLALSLIYTESRFNPYYINSIGCYGYCGLSPMYFPTDLSPADNIKCGISYLGDLIKEYKDLEIALTVYDIGYDDGDRTFANQVINNAKEMGYSG